MKARHPAQHPDTRETLRCVEPGIYRQANNEKKFDTGAIQKSRIIRLSCDRHDFMQNWLYVVDSPYFAISNQSGEFAIDQVPPGRYTLTAWHPILGKKTRNVVVVRKQDLHMEVTFGDS